MPRLLVTVLVGFVSCAEQEMPYDGPTPYLLEQEEFRRTVVSEGPKANFMLLADTSVSMAAGSREEHLKSSMSALVMRHATQVRWALTTFPSPTALVELPPTNEPDSSDVLAASAASVNNALQSLTPSGATDTREALRFVGELASLNAQDNRADAIVLLTGGAPAGDPQETIDRIQALRSERGISTLVVAYSPEPGSDAVFDAMARAGGLPRRCGDDGELCPRVFYDETNAGTLLDAMQPALTPLPSDPCVFQLTLSPEYVAVVLDDVTLTEGTDTYALSGSQLSLLGAACERLRTASVFNPATVVVRAVQKH